MCVESEKCCNWMCAEKGFCSIDDIPFEQQQKLAAKSIGIIAQTGLVPK